MQSSYDSHLPGISPNGATSQYSQDEARPRSQPAQQSQSLADLQNSLAQIVKQNCEQLRLQVQQDLSSFKDEMSEQQDETQDRMVKRIKAADENSFKKKGNAEQAKFNSKLAATLDKANTNLQKNKFQQVAADLKEGMEMLEHRQKLIKMADRSEFGWAVVQEYEADELASDSGDERKIRRAEYHALRRRINYRRVRRNKNFGQSPDDGRQGDSKGEKTSSFVSGRRTPGPNDVCFSCGKQGHWRQQCKQLNSK
ncbi:uncharacterized protein [Ptychodera flava]|uniref:uncharacterized protein n=1 Tax=Ptychodera flava TaxID=63121 RepID=UPI00396AA38D